MVWDNLTLDNIPILNKTKHVCVCGWAFVSKKTSFCAAFLTSVDADVTPQCKKTGCAEPSIVGALECCCRHRRWGCPMTLFTGSSQGLAPLASRIPRRRLSKIGVSMCVRSTCQCSRFNLGRIDATPFQLFLQSVLESLARSTLVTPARYHLHVKGVKGNDWTDRLAGKKPNHYRQLAFRKIWSVEELDCGHKAKDTTPSIAWRRREA